MVAGGAYAVHKHHQRQEEEQYAQGQADEQQYDDVQAAPEESAPAAGDDSVAQLTQLKSLLDSGALTQDEFDAEKQKIIGA
jgi:hypothetical protein